MADIQQLVTLLQSDQPQTRRHSCEQLMFLPVLTQDAINALKIATHDADPSVAKTAQQVIELHQFDVELSQDAIDILNTETERTPFAEQTSFIEKIGEKIIKIEKYLKKRDELDTKYSRIGIFLTFLGTSILAIFIGLVLYWTGAILGFHIPFIFPMLTIILISMPIVNMGKNLGHCRNLPLAISIPVFASILVWVTEHFAGSLLFHSDNSIPLTIIKFGGMVLPITFTSNNFWTTAYWIIELVMLVWLTALINANYPLQPYCEKCNAWHKFKTPVAGTDAKLEQAQNALKANDMITLIKFLSDDQGDNVTHFDLEYCPKCYDNSARLVIVKNTGNGTWEEKIVWEETLEPKYAQEIIQHAI